MREYGKVSPRFWTGKTGKSFRGDANTQLLALYLMTSPHANMIGVYHCPIMYMAHEIGIDLEGASKALGRLIESGFCTFDGEEEVVWVHEMAAHQIGEELSPNDKRVKGVQKQFASIAQSLIRRGFWERYRADFHLGELPDNDSPIEAPSKPLASQEQEQEQEHKPHSEPIGSGTAGASPPIPQAEPEGMTAQDFVWANGVPMLVAAGQGEKPARSLLGRWVKAHGAETVQDSLVRCAKANPVEPVSWMIAALGKPAAPSQSPESQDFAWWVPAGFPDRWEAENAGCTVHSAWMFDDGRKVREDAGDGWVETKRRIEAERRTACSA